MASPAGTGRVDAIRPAREQVTNPALLRRPRPGPEVRSFRMERDVHVKVRLEQMRMLFDTPLPGMLLAVLFWKTAGWLQRHQQAALDGR